MSKIKVMHKKYIGIRYFSPYEPRAYLFWYNPVLAGLSAGMRKRIRGGVYVEHYKGLRLDFNPIWYGMQFPVFRAG